MLVSIVWMLVPLISGSLSVKYSSVIIVIILAWSLPLLLSGWASNSKYAILGSLRGVTPTISYEISLALILLTFPLYANFDRFEEIIKFSKLLPLTMVLPFSCLLRLVSWLVETNRTPFNFQKENQNQFRDLILNTSWVYLLWPYYGVGQNFFLYNEFLSLSWHTSHKPANSYSLLVFSPFTIPRDLSLDTPMVF